MITIRGYKKVSYDTLQIHLHRMYADCGKPSVNIAVELKVKSIQTIRNAFAIKKQKTSDIVFAGVLKSVGVDALILWHNGERHYFISNKYKI